MTGRPGPAKVTKKHKLKSVTQSSRAGLTLPVGRVNRILRNGRYAPRIGLDAAVYLTGVLEYLCAEILELAMRAADDNGRVRISPRHLLLAVGKDDELSRLLEGVIISGGGVIPCIHPNLIPYKAPARNNDTSSQEY